MLEAILQTGLGHFLMTLVSFLILLAIVHKFAWKPINNILEERQHKVSHDIESAEQDKNEAETLLKEAQEDRKKAKLDVNTMVQDGNKKLEHEKELAIKTAEDEIAQMKQEARLKIEQERQAMQEDVQNQVAVLSLQIAEQILQREVNQEDQQKLLDDLLLEMDADKDVEE